MNASVAPLAARSSSSARLESLICAPLPSYVLEGAESSREQQVDDHDRDRDRRERCRQRQVGGYVRVDDVADELRLADQQGRDEIAERQREGEDRSGHERREDE